MQWTDRLGRLSPLFSAAALVAGLWTASAQIASAARPRCRPCPPAYHEYYPDGTYREGMPRAADEGVMGEEGAADADQADQAAQDQPELEPLGAQPASTALASLSPGANTPMLGRLDQNHRLNLFDTQSAIPESRVWYSFQLVDDYNLSTFFTGTSSPVFEDEDGDPINRIDDMLHRVGVELALFDDFSVAFQAQAYDVDDLFVDGDSVDESEWTNPQAMLKWAVLRDRDYTLSVILGATFETDVDVGEINEETSRIFPGVLFQQTLSDDLFVQGGFQFGLPTEEDQIETFDWALGLGYWVYQDCCGGGDCCGDYCGDCGGCGSHGGMVRGVVLQVELLGKHVIGDNTIVDPFELDEVFSPGTTIFVEEEDVVDLTVGGTVLLYDGVRVGAAYSVPVTDDDARKNEFLTTISYGF